MSYIKDAQYVKFCAYGFFKNLRFFDPFLLLFFLSKGLNYVEIGSLYAIREFTINFMEVPSGFIADVLGRKNAMLLSFGAYLVSFVLFYLFHVLWGFVIAFMFYGLGDAFRTGTHKAMILQYLKQHAWHAFKTSYYGNTRAWSQRGSAIAALLSGVLVYLSGDYNTIFVYSLVPYVIDLLLIASYPSYLNGQSVGFPSSIREIFKAHFSLIKSAVVQWSTYKVVTLSSAFSGYYKAVKDYLQPLLVSLALALPFLNHLDETRRSALVIGVVYSIIYFLSARASKLAAWCESRFLSTSKALVVLQIVGVLAGCMAGLAHGLAWHVLAIASMGFIILVQNMRKPISVNYVSDHFDDSIMATALSAESQTETVFVAFFAFVMGVCVNYFGVGWGLMFVSIATGIVFLLLPKVLNVRFKASASGRF